MALLERVSLNKSLNKSLSKTSSKDVFTFLSFDYYKEIFGSGNLKFIISAFHYTGFDASTLKPTLSFTKKLKEWRIERSEVAKRHNSERKEKKPVYDSDSDSNSGGEYGSNNWYDDDWSDDDWSDEDYFIPMEEDADVIYKNEYKKIESNLYYFIACSSFQVFRYFLKINKDLSGVDQTYNAYMACDIKRLEELEKLSKLEFGINFNWQLKIPRGESSKVIQVLDWIERNGCNLFKAKSEKNTEDVRDREVADYLFKKGFKIEPTLEWAKTQDYIDWCFSKKVEPKWSIFLYENTDLGYILDVFEKGKRLGFSPQDSFRCLNIRSIMDKDVSVKNLNRLLALGYDYLQLKGYTLRIYKPPKHFFQFLMDRCLPSETRAILQ